MGKDEYLTDTQAELSVLGNRGYQVALSVWAS